MRGSAINENCSYLCEDEEAEEKFQEKMQNYKGYFVDEAEDEEEEDKYYEHGAHFSYLLLCNRLEVLLQKQKKAESKINRNDNAANHSGEETKLSHHNNRDKDQSFALFNQNKRSRNRNNNNPSDNSKENEKVKTHNVILNNHNMNNKIEAKPQMENEALLLKTKTDYKSILYSIVGSKLKRHTQLNFARKKGLNEGNNRIIMKTVQYSHNKPKRKMLANSFYDNRRAKSKEISMISNKDTSTHILNTKVIDSNKKLNYKKIPKTLNNIIAYYKAKHRAHYSPGLKPDREKAKVKSSQKDKAKRVLTVHYGIQNPKCFEFASEKNSNELLISLGKKKINRPSNLFDNRCQTHSNTKTNDNSKHLFNLREKNIQSILLLKAKTKNPVSRNAPFNKSPFSNIKANHLNKKESNLTQENINHQLNMIDILKQLPISSLQTTKNITKTRPKSKTKTSVFTSNQIKSYFETKYSLKAKPRSNLTHNIEKSIGLSSLLSKAKDKMTNKAIKGNKTKKKIEINTISKGSTNLPGSSSSMATNKHSSITGPRGSNINNSSKASIISKDNKPNKGVIQSYLNSFNKCSNSPKY